MLQPVQAVLVVVPLVLVVAKATPLVQAVLVSAAAMAVVAVLLAGAFQAVAQEASLEAAEVVADTVTEVVAGASTSTFLVS